MNRPASALAAAAGTSTASPGGPKASQASAAAATVASATAGHRAPSLKAAPSPAGRAYGKSQMAAAITHRPATGWSTSTGGRSAGGSAASAAYLISRASTPPATPKLP